MTQPATWALVLVVANGFMDAGLAWADPGPRAPRLLARGVSAQALYSFSRAGELLAHYAVDGHAHSDVSPDSQARLEDMVAAATERGLDALFVSDHCSIAAAPALEALGQLPDVAARGPLLLLGEEAGTTEGHVGLVGLHRRIRPRHDGRLPEALALLAAVNTRSPETLTVLNHPGWGEGRRWLWHHHFDPRQVGPKFDAIEVVNGRWGLRPQTRRLVRRWERLLGFGVRPTPIGGSDAHRAEAVGSVHTVALAADCTPEDLLAALGAGRSYVTSGARIHFAVWGALPGELLQLAPGEEKAWWSVHLSLWTPEAGLLRVYDGKQVVFQTPVQEGLYRASFEHSAWEPKRDGYLRVELVRLRKTGRGPAGAAGRKGPKSREGLEEVVTLLTSPVYYDVFPHGDFWSDPPYVARNRRPGVVRRDLVDRTFAALAGSGASAARQAPDRRPR